MSLYSSGILVALLLVAPDALAQQRYARVPGDTLRYQESTNVDVVVETPQGTFQVDVSSNARLNLTWATADTALAWYTALDITSNTPMGTQRPSTAAVVDQRFTLHTAPDGVVEAVAVPAVPAELRTVSDVRRQFDDFFLVLPDEPLREGMSWNYDRSVSDTARADDSYAFSKRGILTVVGDTTLDGRTAWIIEGDLTSTLNVTMSDPEQGARVSNAFSGIERNRVAFDPERGAMVFRERIAELTGNSRYEGGPMPMSMHQRVRYDSIIRLQP